MKNDNAQIVIDVVMGELQKKESFSSSLAKVAKDAINKGLEKASKVRRTALSQAIVDGVYKETPASKKAIKKLAKTTTLEVNKAIESYNAKKQSKGGFWNFVGSLAVNTGILRFGQGYKGGNFFRDRYLDTYRTMDKRGRITENSKVNYGRVAGDVLSAGQFLAQSMLSIADIINKGIQRIEQQMEEGLDNSQEITAIANTLKLGSTTDLRKIIAGINAIDAITYGTGLKNVSNTLTQYFTNEDNLAVARKAGMRGITPFDLAMEYIQMLVSGKKFNKDGSMIDITEQERKALYQIRPVMATKEFRRKLQENASSYNGMLFAPGGGENTLYAKALAELGSEELTTENFENYKKKVIGLNLHKLSESSKNFMVKGSESIYDRFYSIQEQRLERELKFFRENSVDFFESQERIEKLLGTISDYLQKLVNKLVSPKLNADTAIAAIDVLKILTLAGGGLAIGGPIGAVVGGAAAVGLNTYNKKEED